MCICLVVDGDLGRTRDVEEDAEFVVLSSGRGKKKDSGFQ